MSRKGYSSNWITDAGAKFIVKLMNTPKWIKCVGERNIMTVEDAEAYMILLPCKPKYLLNYRIEK